MGACNSVPRYVGDDDDFNWASFFVNEHNKLCPEMKEIYSNRVLVCHLVQRDGLKLRHINPELLEDPNIIALALKKNGLALQYVPPHKRTKETVRLAVDQNGHALMFAPREWQDVSEVVSAAVAQDPHAFKWASERLKNNKGLVLKVVTKNGFALPYASEELRADEDVISAAVGNQKKAEIYAVKKPTNGDFVQPL